MERRGVRREKSGVSMEKKGVRMEKVGSEGTGVNGGQKKGVRMDRRGVRREKSGVSRDQSCWEGEEWGQKGSELMGGRSVGSGWEGVGSAGTRVNGGEKKGVRMERRGVRRDQSYLGGEVWGQGGKGGGVRRDQSCWESRTVGSPANGADGTKKSGAMGGGKSGAGGRGAACGAMGGVGVAHRLCILPLSLALGGCSSGTPSGDGASLCALRCCSRLYSRSSASSVPAGGGGGGRGVKSGLPPKLGVGVVG